MLHHANLPNQCQGNSAQRHNTAYLEMRAVETLGDLLEQGYHDFGKLRCLQSDERCWWSTNVIPHRMLSMAWFAQVRHLTAN